MGRPKGSKNKPKIILTFGEKAKGTINPELLVLDENKSLSKDTTPTNSLDLQEKDSSNIIESSKIKKVSKVFSCCERCGSEIKCEPRRIDTNMLTGMADYYRATPRYVKLCNNCCKELNQIVEQWLLSGEKGEDLRKKGW